MTSVARPPAKFIKRIRRSGTFLAKGPSSSAARAVRRTPTRPSPTSISQQQAAHFFGCMFQGVKHARRPSFSAKEVGRPTGEKGRTKAFFLFLLWGRIASNRFHAVPLPDFCPERAEAYRPEKVTVLREPLLRAGEETCSQRRGPLPLSCPKLCHSSRQFQCCSLLFRWLSTPKSWSARY